MQRKSHICYVQCTIYEQIYSSRYFVRHGCNLRDTSESNNEMETDDEDLLANNAFDSEGHIVGDLNNDGTSESNDNDSDNEVFQIDLFDELLQEAYLIDDDNDDEILSHKSEYGVLLRWICLFLAHWQRRFNMTDKALYLLLKFLSVSFKVLVIKNFKYS